MDPFGPRFLCSGLYHSSDSVEVLVVARLRWGSPRAFPLWRDTPIDSARANALPLGHCWLGLSLAQLVARMFLAAAAAPLQAKGEKQKQHVREQSSSR